MDNQRKEQQMTVLLTVLMTSYLLDTSYGNLTSTCICLNGKFNLIYQCTTLGIGSTLWSGSALKCGQNGDEIILRHSLFNTSTGANGVCNDGNITGHSLMVEGSSYTSEISVVFSSSDLIGQHIVCAHHNGTIEKDVGVSTIIDPFLPPSDVKLTTVRPGRELRFSWSTVSNCRDIHYRIDSDCGSCPTTTTFNTVICDRVNINNDYNTCSFAVKKVICGHAEGNYSNRVYVTTKGPDAPQITNVIPLYRHKSGILAALQTSIISVEQFNISDGIDGSAVTYTVTYTDVATGSTCGSDILPASLCVTNTCTSVYKILSSNCSHSVSINVTVSATNILGAGPPSYPLQINDMYNNFFNVTIDLETSTAVFTFLNDKDISTKSCSIFVYNQTETCLLKVLPGKQSTQSTSNIIVVTFDLLNGDQVQHCFSATASNGTYTATVTGTFNITQSGEHQTTGQQEHVHFPFEVVMPIVGFAVFIIVVAVTVMTCILLKTKKNKAKGKTFEAEVETEATGVIYEEIMDAKFPHIMDENVAYSGEIQTHMENNTAYNI